MKVERWRGIQRHLAAFHWWTALTDSTLHQSLPLRPGASSPPAAHWPLRLQQCCLEWERAKEQSHWAHIFSAASGGMTLPLQSELHNHSQSTSTKQKPLSSDTILHLKLAQSKPFVYGGTWPKQNNNSICFCFFPHVCYWMIVT